MNYFFRNIGARPPGSIQNATIIQYKYSSLDPAASFLTAQKRLKREKKRNKTKAGDYMRT
jgi:hypothetical protein